MAKNSVLGSPRSVAKLPHQGFNLSSKLKFTSTSGQLLPVMYDHLRPGEKVRLNYSMFTRTQPLDTAAMVDIHEYVDFFFVPMRKIYNNFDQLITSVDDAHSVLLKDKIIPSSLQVIPSFSLSNLAANIVFDQSVVPTNGEVGSYFGYFDLFYQGAGRLLDMLSLSPSVLFNKQGSQAGQIEYTTAEDYYPNVNISSLLAYQAIYYDYYRLSNWEQNYVGAYNIDDMPNNFDIAPRTAGMSKERIKKMFELHYRAYNRDYFKAIEPSPLLSPVGTLSSLASGMLSMPSINQWLGLSDDYVTTNQFDSTEQSSTSSLYGNVLTNVGLQQDTDSGHISLSSLRTAYAYEKLLKITNRAGKHYDDQILAHFGFKVPHGIGNEVYYLGGGHSLLAIGEVISTADTFGGTEENPTGANLAQIAGKGYATNKPMKDINFTAPCDGILMAIYSCVPRLNYVIGLDRLHTRLTKYDYPQPELDNLGMQPLFGYQGVQSSHLPAERMGWQYRYMESKSKFNKSTHAFLGRDAFGQDDYKPAAFHSWTIAPLPFNNSELEPANWYEFLLCRPTDLNDIFLVQYNPALSREQFFSNDRRWFDLMYQRDPLLHDISFKYFKTSFMSTFGLDDIDI